MDDRFMGLSDETVLRRRDAVRREIEETPGYLYPVYRERLELEHVRLNAELGERERDARYTLDELEAVGDDGTLDDAVRRIEDRMEEARRVLGGLGPRRSSVPPTEPQRP